MFGIRRKAPVHPGDFVRWEIIDPLDPTETDAAKALGGREPHWPLF